jgi:tetratricopeptide (TPR) repeat protein
MVVTAAAAALIGGACRNAHEEASPVVAAYAPDDGRTFVDASASAGLHFTHDAGLDGSHFMPEIMGSGCALFDADGDGDLDAFLVGFGPHAPATPRACSALFAQGDDGRFIDVTASSGLVGVPQGMGVATGDVDNDGDLDVYVTGFGADALFRNDGALHFTDVTSLAGIGDPAWSTSAGFFDYDRDGWLDLFVANYVDYDAQRDHCLGALGEPIYCGPTGLRGIPSVLYHGEGGGRFRDVSAEAGIAALPGKGLGVALADFSGDGLPDIFVANDREPAFLWINQGNGRFTEEAMRRGCAVNEFGESEAGMGVALGDVDGDLALDLFVTHLTREKNTLYLAHGGRFVDASSAAGLATPSLPYTGFGTAFLDLELDGDLDVVVVNGAVQREPTIGDDAGVDAFGRAYGETGQLFVNQGKARFDDASATSGDLAESTVGRGLATGDVDDDGDVDLLVTAGAGPARLLLNQTQRHGHFLLVRAIDDALHRDAVGATVTVRVGGTSHVGVVTTACSYLSACDPRLHFGLGQATAVEGFEVTWSDGSTERFDGLAADQSILLRRGLGPHVDIAPMRPRAHEAARPSRPTEREGDHLGPWVGDLPSAAEPQVIAAISEAREAVAARIGDGATHARLAVRLHAHEMLPQAADEYAQAAELLPLDARWPYLEGIALLQSRPQAALAAFDIAIGKQPKFIPALVHRAHALRMLGRPDEAARSLDAVLALDPRCAESLLERAQIERALQHPDGAIALLEDALRVAPMSRELHAELSAALRDAGRDADADREALAAAHGQSVRLLKDPLLDQVDAECVSTTCLLDRATALQASDPSAALVLLDRVIALRPDLPEPPRMRRQLIEQRVRGR